MADNWKEYQEEAAEFFRSLGLTASTDVTVKGVRTEHDIDVFVEIELAGFIVRWAVECKHWKSPVNKLHVLALREIVADIGADRGLLLCEVGFQSGAIEAANLTNVQVGSLGALRTSSGSAIASFRLRDLFDRASVCQDRYWEISKSRRIDCGLRPDLTGGSLYSGVSVVEVTMKYIRLSFRDAFPIVVDPFDKMRLDRDVLSPLKNPEEVFLAFGPLIEELEGKLDAAEA